MSTENTLQQATLSPREKELLPQFETFIKDFVAKHGKLPTRNVLQNTFHCKEISAGNVRAHLIQTGKITVPQDSKTANGDVLTLNSETEASIGQRDVFKEGGNIWELSLPKTEIHTLEQLIDYCKIDLEIWEVDRWECNKWNMGFVSKATKEEFSFPATVENEGTHYEKNVPARKTSEKNFEGASRALYQVKAFLKKRDPRTEDELLKDNSRLLVQLASLRTQLNGSKAYQKRLASGHMGADDLMDNIKAFVDTLGDLSLPRTIIHPAKPLALPPVRSTHSEDAVLLLSDTHFGDRIKREDTAGFPEFNLTISGNRFGYVMKKAKQVLSLHRAMYPLKRLYIWFGGDIGNGILHDSPNSNDLFPPAQVHFSYHMLKFGIEDLLTLTEPDENGARAVEEIVLLFTVGNHMRMDDKMPHKYQAQRTLDWLIYQFLIERFGSHPKVRIRQEMSPYIFENIRGHRYGFAHGMQVGYRNSPDAQCKSMGQFIDRVRALFDSPQWRRANNLQGATFDRFCIGDIHVPVSFPRLKSNGSLNGQNELGVNWTLEPIPAGQQIFGVSDNHQETWQYFLDCSHVQEKKGDFNPYGIFAADYAKKIGRGL